MTKSKGSTTNETFSKDDDLESVSLDDFKSVGGNSSVDFYDIQDEEEYRQKELQSASAKDSSFTLENLNKHNEQLKLNERDGNGRTELMHLAEAGDYAKVKELIQKGADVTLADKDGNTALMLACRENKFDAARMIVEAMEPKLTQETTPEQYNNALIRKFYFVNQKNSRGDSALSIAARRWTGFALNNYLIKQSGAESPERYIKSVKAKINDEISIHRKLRDSAQKIGTSIGKELEDKQILSLTQKLEAVDRIMPNLAIIPVVSQKTKTKADEALEKSLAKFASIKEKSKARSEDKFNSLFDRMGGVTTINDPKFKEKLSSFESEYLDDINQFVEKRKEAKKEANTINNKTVASSPKLAKHAKAQKQAVLKTQLASINSKEKAFKEDLKQQQKELGKDIRKDRLARIFGGEVSGYTRDELIEMQKTLGRVIRSDQATGIVDKIFPGRKKNDKGRTQ